MEEKTVIDGGHAVQTTIRSSGRIDFTTVPQVDVGATSFTSRWSQVPATVNKSVDEITRDADGLRLLLGGAGPPLGATAEPWRETGDDADPDLTGPFRFSTRVVVALIITGWSLAS